MTREQLERALREAEPPDAGPARERARRTVLAAHAAHRSRRRVRRAVPLVWAALAAILAALVVTQRDSGPAQAVERLVREIVLDVAAREALPAARGERDRAVRDAVRPVGVAAVRGAVAAVGAGPAEGVVRAIGVTRIGHSDHLLLGHVLA